MPFAMTRDQEGFGEGSAMVNVQDSEIDHLTIIVISLLIYSIFTMSLIFIIIHVSFLGI